jgi:hypothetical protein
MSSKEKKSSLSIAKSRNKLFKGFKEKGFTQQQQQQQQQL